MQQLLEVFCTQWRSERKQGKRFPLIVLEGLEGLGKTTISEWLSRELNAQLLCHPKYNTP